MTINVKNDIIDNINMYIYIQEKKDIIDLSLYNSSDLNDIIEIVKNSSDKKKTIDMFNEKIRIKLQKLCHPRIVWE